MAIMVMAIIIIVIAIVVTCFLWLLLNAIIQCYYGNAFVLNQNLPIENIALTDMTSITNCSEAPPNQPNVSTIESA